MAQIAKKADSLAVERAARRGRKRVARRTTATTAVGGEEPPKKTGSPVPKPKPRTSAQRKGTAQARKGFSAEIEQARKIIATKGMTDAEKYSYILAIGGMAAQIPIKNIVSGTWFEPTASFDKVTYLSKIGLYDKNKNLIGAAKLASPVRKREVDEFTFKLKLDF